MPGPLVARRRSAAEHDTAREHRRLSSIVRCHLRLGAVDEDARLFGTGTTGASGRSGGAELLVSGGTAGHRREGGERPVGVAGRRSRAEGEVRARGGRTRARTGVAGDGAGCGGGNDRELVEEGSHPSGDAHFVSDHGKKLFVILHILSHQLPGKGLSLQRPVGRHLLNNGAGELIGPDGEQLANRGRTPLAEARGDAPGICEKVEFNATEGCDPSGPLDVGGETGGLNWAGRGTRGRKGEAAASRAAQRLVSDPGGGEEERQVFFEGGLQLGDDGGRVVAGKSAGEVCDGVREGDGKTRGCGEGGHCDDVECRKDERCVCYEGSTCDRVRK